MEDSQISSLKSMHFSDFNHIWTIQLEWQVFGPAIQVGLVCN